MSRERRETGVKTLAQATETSRGSAGVLLILFFSFLVSLFLSFSFLFLIPGFQPYKWIIFQGLKEQKIKAVL